MMEKLKKPLDKINWYYYSWSVAQEFATNGQCCHEEDRDKFCNKYNKNCTECWYCSSDYLRTKWMTKPRKLKRHKCKNNMPLGN